MDVRVLQIYKQYSVGRYINTQTGAQHVICCQLHLEVLCPKKYLETNIWVRKHGCRTQALATSPEHPSPLPPTTTTTTKDTMAQDSMFV